MVTTLPNRNLQAAKRPARTWSDGKTIGKMIGKTIGRSYRLRSSEGLCPNFLRKTVLKWDELLNPN